MLSWLLSASSYLGSTNVVSRSALQKRLSACSLHSQVASTKTSSWWLWGQPGLPYCLCSQHHQWELKALWVSRFCAQPSCQEKSHATWHFGTSLWFLLLTWPEVEPWVKEFSSLSNRIVCINMIKQAIHSELCIWDKLKLFVQWNWMHLS